MAVEVKIGITESPRELIVATPLTSDEAYNEVEAALGGSKELLTLVDERGARYIVPVTKIAYVEVGAAESRRVGFGS
ncbi:DUF3107 domain-containing protein [Gordonia paraffinivorans]|uniref:DUF3107 domain-containing protein n=1 Tax=Gordonia paraffinivorans TaxID=175628 RepID=UPI001444BE1D|nr:DUF3107 domain-containing protein [Gordonia paraffinivorans]